MRLRTEVIALRTLPAGSPVGYGAAHRVPRTSRIATVPVGYGDGLLRAASSQGHMLVRGERCPVVGPIAMDLTSLDVTDVPGVVVGDEVVLLGTQGAQAITADDLGQCAQTIPYEILTNVSRRVPRFYTYGFAANA